MSKATTYRIVVDWPRCEARGLCHELAPDVIGVDRWRYPVIKSNVNLRQLDDVREAVAACPRRALILLPEDPTAS